MPAPKSRLIQENKPFAPVDNAIRLYRKVVEVCLKMPKRYTYLILQDVIELAGRVMDNAKGANSVFPTNQHEVQIRRDYWIHARANLQALSTRIDRFLEVPGTLTYHDERSDKTKGVTTKELEEIADLIGAEMALITKALEEEKKRFKSLPETL